MAIVPARYGTGKYGQSKYGVLAVLSLAGSSTLKFMTMTNNKVKVSAKASINFVLSTFARANNFPFKRTRQL